MHDTAAHVDTVFRRLGGRARFVRAGSRAVGIAVESGGRLGFERLYSYRHCVAPPAGAQQLAGPGQAAESC